MKKNILLSALLLFIGGTSLAQQRATEFNVRPAVVIRTPLQGDSINFKGEKFTETNLLKSSINLSFDGFAYERQTTDTAGVLTLAKAGQDAYIYLLSTRLRAERFLKGKLNITSPVRFEVFINGVSRQMKESAEDSLSQVRPFSIPLRLEGEADQEIVIKLLSTAADKLAPSVKCELVKDDAFADIPCHLSPDLKKRFALHHTVLGKRVTSVSLSPNGKYLLTRYSERYSKDRARTHTELTELKSGRLLLAETPAGVRWMPRSSKLCYTVPGERDNDLLTYDPATGETRTVLRGVPAGRFTWAPTEDYLIYSNEDEGEKVSGPLKRHHDPDDRIPGARSRSYLVKYDPLTGLSERLVYGSHSVYLNDISPDGKRLLCSTGRTVHDWPFSQTSFFELELATLRTDTLVAWDGHLSSASYSPDGRQLLLIGTPNALDGIGKNCAPHPIANDYDIQAFLFDLSTRQASPITKDFNPSIDDYQWNRADGCIYFNTTDQDLRTVYRYTPKSGTFERLPLQEDVVSVFSMGDDNAQVAAYVGGGNTSVGVAYAYDLKKRASTLIANPMKPMLDEIRFGEMSEWNFTAQDGTEITGMICLPPDFDAQKKYPLVVYYYGGTTPTTRGITSPYCAQLFASHDYVVYVIQPSGAIGYGQEFSARHVNAWGDYTADEIIEGTRKFCEAHPFVDATRIGCCGASYGGFMTMYLQTKTDLFRAAISHAGISNVTSYWGEGYWGYSYNSVAAAQSYPWSNPDLFTKHGALFNADKINTPLLLLHGNADTNVPMGESIQLYNALKILGKPVEFITVDAQDHHIVDYDKRILWHNSMLAWFAKHLQDSPAWWDDLYPERHW